eukprot:TRINITY_DN6139_c0_g1_i1.p1 TRINITY_DN6139_c0_g1~~TRINITY_DN6139_c0_g1_i1.p1  ORF type:complete len:335 (+),score=143.21 TRINITY_DN6139_c0_g1_i1:48-1052(+)
MSKRKLQGIEQIVNMKNIEEEDFEDEEESEGEEEEVEENEEDEEAAFSFIEDLKRRMAEEKVVTKKFQSTEPAPSKFFNKQRVLILSSRGTHSAYRHLMQNLSDILPHSKKDSKFDSRDPLKNINEICELRSCTGAIFFEQTKRDCFVWLAKTPNGPSARCQLSNVHTLEELKLFGNCLKGSRPMLVFDKIFETQPHLLVMKELLFQTFGTPKKHPKSKPFVDHVLSFQYVDNRIWFRHYQISEDDPEKKRTENELVEIGPRFILNIVRIFAGSFGGPTLYLNAEFEQHKQDLKDQKAAREAQTFGKMALKKKHQDKKMKTIRVEDDPLDTVFD